MKYLDGIGEKAARAIAKRTSRRNLLATLGKLFVGSSMIPLLPVVRAAGDTAIEDVTEKSKDCNYWRYCAIDGFLCSCCGGSYDTCPPGTEMSPITWIGTCRNPADGKDYIVSYNDCCGKSACGRCLCTRNQGTRPMHTPFLSNEYNWCLGTSSQAYHCSTSIVLGVATPQS